MNISHRTNRVLMTTYEDQYYLVKKKYDENTLYLTPFEKTMQRRICLEKLPYGEEPLFLKMLLKKKTNNMESAGL